MRPPASEPSTPARLSRLTTEYDVEEDRLRLSGESETGGPLVIWLTQRLLRRLLPPLFDWLEQRAPDALYRDALQELTQTRAVAAMAPEPPVRPPPAASAWRAQSVDLTRGAAGVRLVFRGSRGEAAWLAMNELALRQWLEILRQCCLRAEWPVDLWPSWFAAPRPATGQGRGNITLH